jgi:single-strand DNA-binding protein
MAGLNKVFILGNLGKDPEVRYTADGNAIASFSVATSYKPKGGNERTDWHRIVAFGATAEVVSEYVRKGDRILVEGHLSYRSYEKDGAKVYVTEIVADQVHLLGQKREAVGGEDGPAPRRAPQRSSAPPSVADMDDDVPF